jgi:hypothetical protein
VIKSILVVLPNNEDATSFYRGMGPISAMRRTRDMNLMFTNKASWPAVKASDVVFIQRPHDPSHLTLAETTKENNRPLWIDFDDLLFDIPNDNPAHNDYMRKETRLRIIEIIKMADVVTVSTPQLKKCLQVKGGVLNNNVHVVPNALDDDLLIHAKPFNLKKLVSWRGSPTHLNDCLVNGNGITAFAKEHKDWAFAFFGTNPWPITNCIEQNRALIVPPLTVDKYFKMGSTMNASVMMVPLADNLFNRCKCLIAGTRVSTSSGFLPIEQIKKGDHVFGPDGGTHLVSSTIRYQRRQTAKVITENGYEISGTMNHRIMTPDGYRSLEDLQVGDEVTLGVPKFGSEYQRVSMDGFKQQNRATQAIDESLMPSVLINEEWGQFLGVLLGDGTISGYNRTGISMSVDHTDMMAWVQKFSSGLGLNTTQIRKKGKGVDVYINSVILRNFLAYKIGFMGIRDKVLSVPECIWRSPRSVIAAFLRGCFDTDGTVSSCQVSFATKQETLAKQVQILLLGFGIKSTIDKRFNDTYKKNYFNLRIGRQGCDIYHSEIGFISKDKQKKLSDVCSKGHSNAYKEWSLTSKISFISESVEDVYDIEVPDGRCYIANGIVSHNSNIAWIEATLFGGVAVGPNWEEWDRPGVIRYGYQPGDTIFEALDRCASNPELLAEYHKLAMDYIRQNLMLSNVNKKRFHIMNALLSGKPIEGGEPYENV